ncbi:MAG: DUF1559 domain-containing protein [Pirellula sp.]
MPFEFVCPYCHCKTKVLDSYAGQSGPCVECGKQVTMPHFNERGVLVPSMDLTAKQKRKHIVRKPNWMSAMVGSAVVATVLLMGLLVFWLAWPSLQHRMRRIAQARDLENMQTIVEALNAYCDKHGKFPTPTVFDDAGKPLYSWRVLILPFMGYEDLYNQFELTQAWDSPSNMNLVRRMPNEFASPNSVDAFSNFETNYALITGAGTLFPPAGPLSNSRIDKQTILVVETKNNTTWSKPGDIDIGRRLKVGNTPMTDLGGLHQGSFTAVTVDKESLRIPSNVSQVVLDALVTPNGGENVQISTFME